MNSWTLPYLAGLFDGEGCVMIVIRTIKERGKVYYGYSLITTITNTDKNLLIFCKENMNLGHINVVGKGLGKWKKSYVWRCCANQSQIFLEAILPYLILKKERAILAIKFQKMHHFNKADKRDKLGRFASGGGVYSLEETNRMIELRNEIMKLNKKGN